MRVSCGSVGLWDSKRTRFSVSDDEIDDVIKDGCRTMVVEKRQQKSHLPWSVQTSGVSGQQGVTHGVHHRGQILRCIVRHSRETVGQGRDVRRPIILSGLRGHRGQKLRLLPIDVISAAKQLCQKTMMSSVTSLLEVYVGL